MLIIHDVITVCLKITLFAVFDQMMKAHFFDSIFKLKITA